MSECVLLLILITICSPFKRPQATASRTKKKHIFNCLLFISLLTLIYCIAYCIFVYMRIIKKIVYVQNIVWKFNKLILSWCLNFIKF